MAKKLTQEEINSRLEQLQIDLEEKKEEKTEIESEIAEIESEIEELENYEDPRTQEEKTEDATRAVSLTLLNTEHMYKLTFGENKETIKNLCYNVFWPDGIIDDESLDDVDWDEIESDCEDSNKKSEINENSCKDCRKDIPSNKCECNLCYYCECCNQLHDDCECLDDEQNRELYENIQKITDTKKKINPFNFKINLQ